MIADRNKFIYNNRELAYLNLDWDLIDKIQNTNKTPLKTRTLRPEIDLLRVIRDPKNFYFTCKYILNKEILPFQNVILQELWARPFPMLIGSRGSAKSFTLGLYCCLRALLNQGCKIAITGAVFRQSKVVFEYIEQIWENAPILRDLCAGHEKSNGPHHDVDRWFFGIGDSRVSAYPIGDGCLSHSTPITYDDHFGTISENNIEPTTYTNAKIWGNGDFNVSDESYYNGINPTKIIMTKKGFSFEGTHNHKMKVFRNGIIDFVRADEMVIGDRILLDRTPRWHKGDCEDISVDDAYILGAMIGNGCWTDQYALGYATMDREPIDIIRSKIGTHWRESSDGIHWECYGKKNRQDWLDKWGMKTCYAISKTLPLKIRKCNQEKMTACLQGLFDTDGTTQVIYFNGGMQVSVSFTTISETLVRQMQYILLHYGIVCDVSFRRRNEEHEVAYELHINGRNAKKFAKLINFRLTRKRKKLENGILLQKKDKTFDNVPGIKELMIEVSSAYKIKYKIPEIYPKKIKAQKNITFDLVSKFLSIYDGLDDWRVHKIKELANPNYYYDEIESITDGECPTFDIHVPDGHEYCANGFFSHNTKIRGQRANYLVCDEFATMNPEIYENIIAGFAFVSADPVSKVKEHASIEALKGIKLWTPEQEENNRLNYKGNQSILAGTAYYSWNHLYTYFSKYKAIIESKGNKDKLAEVMKDVNLDGFDWRDYSIIRLPLEVVPAGLMDIKQVARSRATAHSAIFQMEFGAVFAKDSNGFFRRTLIEGCVCNKAILKEEGPVKFSASLNGRPDKRYVYAIDPASELDKFSIVILELHADHVRVVYCWTTDKEEHRARLKKGSISENDFFSYVNRKIRSLMKTFPCAHIAMDAQGGGNSVMEAFRNSSGMKDGELPLLLITPDNPLSDKKERDCDDEPGLHIVELIQFAKYEWTAAANHNMKKDFEEKFILFPYFNPLEISFAEEKDLQEHREFDTLSDCVMEIEALKDELATIEMTATPLGREHWDTPEQKISGSKKGRQRKDRYSALLMASAAARVINKYVPKENYYAPVGGFVGQTITQGKVEGRLYIGPAWIMNHPTNNTTLGTSVNLNPFSALPTNSPQHERFR